jgi:hypothetical protein
MIAGLSTRCAFLRHALMRCAMVGLIALAAAAIVRPAAAQAPAAVTNPHPSPAALLIAKRIVEIKGVKAMFEPVVRGVVEKAKSVFLQTNFMWSKDIEAVAVLMHKEYDPRVNELIDETARVYATHFTEPELKDILAFYQSPLGQKMITEEPKAIDESMLDAAKWADNLSEDVMAKMRAEMKKRGHDM